MNITFLGATQQVTGSCHLLQVGNLRILLDCGLQQGGDDSHEQNHADFLFEPSSIDAVILSHAHLDHSGRLPLLVDKGFRGPIYAHPATIDLCAILLEDAAYLNERGAFWENRKRQRKGLELVEPLYTRTQARRCLEHFQAIEYHSEKQIFNDVKVTMHDAGHILGSCIVGLKLTEQNTHKTVIYSGDLGHANAPILNDPAILTEADLVIMESTYGDRLHRSWEDTWNELGDIFTRAHSDKGNILIPAFTVGRTQEILYCFNRYYKEWGLENWNIFLDSPMAIETTKVYSKYSSLYSPGEHKNLTKYGNTFSLPNLRFTASTEESMALNRVQSGAIIIAGSGMCNGGRIKHHLKHNLWRHQSHIIIVGFQARSTPGRALVDGAQWLSLWGEDIKVNAHIHTPGGLSAHADQQGLINWYKNFTHKPKLVLVHGEAEYQSVLREELKQQLGINAIIAKHKQTIEL